MLPQTTALGKPGKRLPVKNAIDSFDDIPSLDCTAAGGATTDDNTFIFTQPSKSVYSYTGGDQKYLVPEGVTSIDVKMWAGGGGGGSGDNDSAQEGYGGGGGAGGYGGVRPGWSVE